MPPFEDIAQTLWELMTIPAAVAAVVMALSAKCRLAAVGAVLAMAFGFYAGNYRNHAAPLSLELGENVSVVEIAKSGYRAVIGERSAPPRFWLPWAALFAGLFGLVTTLPMNRWLAAAIRAAIAVVAGRLLTSPEQREAIAWLWPALAVAMFILWLTLETLTAEGPVVPACIGLAFYFAGAIALHAHSARLMEIGLIVGSCWIGLAVAAGKWALDVSAAVPMAAVLLPGLMLITHGTTDSRVPIQAFVLAGIAPLGFLPVALLRLRGSSSPRLLFVGTILILAADGYALRMAMQVEKLIFD